MKTHIKVRNIQIVNKMNAPLIVKVDFVVQQAPRKLQDPKYAAIQKLWDYFYEFDAEVNLLGDEEN